MRTLLRGVLFLAVYWSVFFLSGDEASAAPSGNILRLVSHLQSAPWNALTQNGVAFSCTRLQNPTALSSAVNSGNRFVAFNIYCGTPHWAGTKFQFHLPAGFFGGAASPERFGTNSVQVAAATVCLDTTCSGGINYPATFNGKQGVNIVVPGDGQWSDPVAGLTLPTDSKVYIRIFIAQAVGDKYPAGMTLSLPGADMGEGNATSSTSQSALYTSGSIPSTSSNFISYGPDMAVAVDPDASPVVFLLNGTSRMYGQNNAKYTIATRGTINGIAMGLDDNSTTTRYAYGNLSAEGAYAQYTDFNYNAAFQYRMQALRRLPNRPFNRIFTDINPNDINNGGGPTTLSGMQAVDRDWWNFWTTNCPDCIIYHYFGEPWANTASNNTSWTTTGDQVPASTAVYPSGLQFQVNNWLAANIGLRSNVIPIDLSAAYQNGGASGVWPISGITGTVAGACTSGTRTCTVTLTSQPGLGDAVVLGVNAPGVANLLFSGITGTCTASCAILTGAGLGATFANGTAVGIAYTHDGVHEGGSLATNAAAIIISDKLSGLIH